MRALAALVMMLGLGSGGCASGVAGAGGADAAPGDAAVGDAGADGAVTAGCERARPLPEWASYDDGRLVARCAGVTVRVAALAEGMVRLTYGEEPPTPRPWSVVAALDPEVAVTVGGAGAGGGGVELCTPALRVTIEADGCRVRVADADGAVLVEDGAGGGYSEAGGAVAVTRRTPAGERFYGFGERVGPLDKRGQRMIFWSTDAYEPSLGGWAPEQDPLYVSIPFFVGLREGVAYGVFTDNTFRLEMDMARAAPEAYRIEAAGGAIDQYVIAGPRIAEVVRRYTALTGRTPLPPRWALGYHQSRWGYRPASRVDEIAQGFRSRGIGADAVWLDIQHMDGFRTFTWDADAFADPAAMTARLWDDGFATVVIADPGIKVDPGWDVYDTGVSGDHFLREPDGTIYQGQAWPGAVVFPDFTRAETRQWWAERVGGLVELGVRGIWLDLNEPTTFPEGGEGTTVPDEVLARGDTTPATMAEVHNVYANLEAQATYEGMREAAPAQRPFILSRAGYGGIQRYAAIWTGDTVSSWWGLRQTLPMLLGLGLSGVPLVGSDVGGYSGHATPELYARWMALGSISPFFRGHVTNGVSDQEPWAFGAEVEAISRALIAERYRLLPYLYSLLADAEATGAPLLRPMVYEFQDDPATHALGDQAMLGPYLLVAPLMTEGATARSVYLPAGRWFELHSGAAYEGPATLEVGATLAALPVFVRAGAILPRLEAAAHTRAQGGPLHLDLYPGETGSELSFYEDAGEGFGYRDDDAYRRVRYRLEPTATGARLTAAREAGSYQPAPRTLVIRVRRVDSAPSAVRRGATALPVRADLATALAAGGWVWDARDLSAVVVLDEADDLTVELDYDRTLSELRPPIAYPVEVALPAGTPAGAIHIATSASGWAHAPLQRVDATTARGEILVPRGEWFFYKYSRGAWETVEKYGDCGEANNRYRFAAAGTAGADAVERWRDWCE